MPGKPNNKNLQRIVSVHGNKLGALEKSTHGLQRETGDLKTSLAALTGKLPNGWKAPQVIVAMVATSVGLLSCLATLGTLWYNTTKVDKLAGLINGKGGIKDSLSLQADGEGRLESAIRLLTAAVAPQLVHELDKALERAVAAAEQQGPKDVSLVVASFSNQVKFLRETNTPAGQGFFSNSASTLERVASKYPSDGPDVHAAIEALAAYHSAVVQPSNLVKIFAPGSNQAITTEDLANLRRDKDSSLGGFKVYRMNGPWMYTPGTSVVGDQGEILFNIQNGDAFTAAPGSDVPGGQRIIKGLLLVTPTQALDGFIWQNVVFANARIRYMGGPVTLKNVRFVNCTFDTPSKIGQPILNYAINLQPDLTLTGSRT